MSEENETTIKITDRRRYNPDGSLREGFTEVETPDVAPPPEAQGAESDVESRETVISVEEVEEIEEVAGGSADNVVSFPGAAAKPANDPAGDKDRSEAKPPKPAAKAAAASAVSAQAASAQQQAAAEQAAQAAIIENAYHQESRQGAGAQSRLPQASFMALLNMLAVESAMHLGLMETEPGARTPVDLEAARHMIDMIGLVQEKTRGNLTAEESSVLEQVLADLRMQYVALARRR